MSAIDYSRLLDQLQAGSIAPLVAHNAATAIAIHGGTDVALSAPVHFSPRDEYWFLLERRIFVAFLATHWQQWPDSAAEQAALMSTALAIGKHLDAAPTARVIRSTGVDYKQPGALAALVAPLLAHVEKLPPLPDWHLLQKRRLKGQTAIQALKGILQRAADEGFSELESSVQVNLRWYPFLGATTALEVEQRESFFVAYAHAVMTTNAYKTAGAQYFGPVVGNTSTTTFLEAIAAWRTGKSLDEAPLIALDSSADPAKPRSHTNIVRELWGFLNLHRVPFYNSRVAEYAALTGSADPLAITGAIGAQTLNFLDTHPADQARAAAMFPAILASAAPNNGKAFAFSRRPPDDDADSVDAIISKTIRDAGVRCLLEFDARARAAIVLHLALDADVYRESLRADELARTSTTETPTISGAQRLWIYAPGRATSNWAADQKDEAASIDWPLGDLRAYDTIEDLAAACTHLDGDAAYIARTCWRFCHEVKVGDRIVARKGRSTIIGIGVVVAAYRHIADRDFSHEVGVRWQWTGAHALRDRNTLAFTTLVESSQRTTLVAEIDAILARDTTEVVAVVDDEPIDAAYTIDDAAQDLFAGVPWLEHQVQLLRRKKNIILQGPPGVGKTFVAKRLAYLLMGVRNDDRVETVQFHPSYSYEQFVRGYRPNGSGGFAVANGPLVRLAERAKGDPDNAYVLVIDEINRGHLGKILGEAMMLLEADKRDVSWGVQLAYPAPGLDGAVDGERFWLPDNLYVIGTMNTADRSLAVVDYALRRRFAFVNLQPAFAEPAFRAHLAHLPTPFIDDVVDRLARLNELICADAGLGRGFQIGHSPFCQPTKIAVDTRDAWLEDVLRHEVLPLLEEYWFDAPAAVHKARQVLGLL